MDTEEGPYSLLKTQVPNLSKALLNQLKSPKTPPATLQAGFSLLYSLLNVLPGSLSGQVPLITATSSNLLPTLTPPLLKAVRERHPRNASESFKVFSSLLQAVKPVKNADWTDVLYEQALTRLTSNDTDAEVRASAEECIGDLWICATDTMKTKNRREWEAICRQTGRTEGAVRVITKVASEVTVSDEWANGCVEWLIGLLKKAGRSGKADTFVAIDVLLKSYTSGIPPTLPITLITHIKPYLSVSDISLLSQALNSLSILLELAPSTKFPEVEKTLLTTMYSISHSPLVAGSD
ncbi:hypothetical protein MPER_02831 [Moniliophthora perniciosa FA553]|nr:hypothetical protein MPER_02831 [Moniliophthora perniciosa FA553]